MHFTWSLPWSRPHVLFTTTLPHARSSVENFSLCRSSSWFSSLSPPQLFLLSWLHFAGRQGVWIIKSSHRESGEVLTEREREREISHILELHFVYDAEYPQLCTFYLNVFPHPWAFWQLNILFPLFHHLHFSLVLIICLKLNGPRLSCWKIFENSLICYTFFFFCFLRKRTAIANAYLPVDIKQTRSSW